MKLVFCFTGKTFKGPFQELQDDFAGRLKRYTRVEIIETKELKPQTRPGTHVLLDPTGKVMDSLKFSKFIEVLLNRGQKNIFFYIGGPTGFDDEFQQINAQKISFSPMTFNHQLIRVMLLEQVYRAFTIIKGEPYHK